MARVQENPDLAVKLRHFDWVVIYGYNGETAAQIEAVARTAQLHQVTERFTNATGSVAAIRCEGTYAS